MKEFYIECDGINLHARMKFPNSNQEKVPMVIVINGLTGTMDEEQLLAACHAAEDNHMAYIQVELYGHGKSGGDFFLHTVSKWAEELEYVVNYVKKMPEVSDIYLAGHSQGGLTALLVAPKVQEIIKSLILISPAMCISSDAKEGKFFGETFDMENLPKQLTFWDGFAVSGNYLKDAVSLRPDDAINEFKKQVLIVHGTSDESVPCKDSEELADLYENAQLVLIEGGLHCFDNHVAKLRAVVSDFLKQEAEKL